MYIVCQEKKYTTYGVKKRCSLKIFRIGPYKLNSEELEGIARKFFVCRP